MGGGGTLAARRAQARLNGKSLRQHYLDQVQRVICARKTLSLLAIRQAPRMAKATAPAAGRQGIEPLGETCHNGTAVDFNQ
jgi:hypothetical protein